MPPLPRSRSRDDWFDLNAPELEAGPAGVAQLQPPPPGGPPAGAPTPTASTSRWGSSGVDQVSAAYQQYLGRAATAGEAERWFLSDDPAHRNDINNQTWTDQRIKDLQATEEAQNFARQGGGGTASGFFDAQGAFNGDYQGYFNSLFPGETLTGADLKAKEAELKRAGIELVTSASGNTAWVRYPGSGGDIDVIGDYGGANRKSWQLPGSGGAAAGAAGAPASGEGLGAIGAGTLLQPFQESFARPTFAPPPDFVAPTGQEVFQDPGFQFRMDQGQQALERSAAAKGTLLTTGTLKDLGQFSQGLASQEYGNVYGRRAGEYESKYGKKVENFERDYNQALGEYGIRKGNFYEGQDRPFNKLTTLAGMGSLPPTNYAGQYGQLQLMGANQAGNYLTQGANASAAGQVGSSNAWQGAFGNLANLGGQYAAAYSAPWQSRYTPGLIQ